MSPHRRGESQHHRHDDDKTAAQGPTGTAGAAGEPGHRERARGREDSSTKPLHQGITSLDELNDLFKAWAEQVANRRVHAETKETPIVRFQAQGPHRQADPERLKEVFRWAVTRKVTRTATVPLEGNAYAVDPALVGRRVACRSSSWHARAFSCA